MREHLDVDIGRLVPAIALALERAFESARGIEEQEGSIGVILAGSAQAGIRSVVVPHERLALVAGNRAAISPDAESVFDSAFHHLLEIIEVELPDPQRRTEIVV